MDSIRISIVQTDIVWENKQENLRLLHEKLQSLCGTTEIVVLPEMFSTGFSMQSDMLAEANSGETITTLKQWASLFQVAICGSYITVDNGRYYNRAFFLTPEGEEFYYDKRHLFAPGGEARQYTPGDSRAVVEYGGVRFLLLVCYDLRFPVWSRCRGDYDAILCCASWPAPRREVWRTLLRARAIENQCYAAGVNRVGDDPAARYAGDSALVDFKGRTMVEAGGGERILTGVFDTEALAAFREKFPAWRDADEFVLK